MTPDWPVAPRPPDGAPNVIVVLFDDVGFGDFGCYGSEIATPVIDELAAGGLRYRSFHTTAMCSTTRAALLTGRNHHSVGMGCLANFDSGYPGYRGKIAASAGTLPEMLAPHGYRSYMVGKWHVTPLTETGPTGPFDGWPLARGFDRFYGFLDAETDQYAPELVADNSHITPPGTYETGYHLTADLVDASLRFVKDHQAGAPDDPFLLWLGFGACHAPHQAPRELIDHYVEVFAKGWDRTREDRLARQIEMGVVPPDTRLPDRNDGVLAWDDTRPEDREVFVRLQAAYAAMLDHADQQLGRLVSFLDEAELLDDTLVLVLSDNGASQEGGMKGFVNAMGPFNLVHESMDRKRELLDTIGGPGTHCNFPLGWAMAANTPLRRYKQNTHGGGIRDPLVVHWPRRVTDHGGVRSQFCHANDMVPTLLDLIGIDPPAQVGGIDQTPLEGASFAATLTDADAPPPKHAQYFEMFGHRGVWNDGWKAVAYHPPGTAFADDRWELFDLDNDFAEVHDRADEEPDRLRALIDQWWQQAGAHQVLPLDDRFAERFAENAARHHGTRRRYVFWDGMGHLPTDVAPDLRARSYLIEAEVDVPDDGAEGVLVAHGDATSGYSLYIATDGHLVHDLNVGGSHSVVRSDRPVAAGRHRLAFRLTRSAEGMGAGELLVDDEPVGQMVPTADRFFVTISWSGLDVGLDRSSPVGDYLSPFAFTGDLRRVIVDLGDDQALDHDAVGRAELGRE
ncbi:MAG: arylsulfatase [Acidimicrobiales bacterium]